MGRTLGPSSTGPGALSASPPSLPQRLPARGGGRATSDFQTLGPWELPHLDRFAESSIPGSQYSTAGFIAEWSLAPQGLQATAFLTRPSPSTAFARVLSATERPGAGEAPSPQGDPDRLENAALGGGRGAGWRGLLLTPPSGGHPADCRRGAERAARGRVSAPAQQVPRARRGPGSVHVASTRTGVSAGVTQGCSLSQSRQGRRVGWFV